MNENLKNQIIKNSLLFTAFLEGLPFDKYGMKEFQKDEKWLVEHIRKKLDSIPLDVYEITTLAKGQNEKKLKDTLNDMFRKIMKAEFPELYKRTVNAKLRDKVLDRDNYKCQYCGIDLRDNTDYNLPPTVDHVIPVRSGGKDDLNNLVACCRRCNLGKIDYTDFEYKDRKNKIE